MKELLNKKFGPFDGKTWVIIVVAGVGIGLIIRRKVAKDQSTDVVDGGETYDNLATTAVGTSPSYGGGTQFNQGAILGAVKAEFDPKFNELYEAIDKQNPAAKTTDPTTVGPEKGLLGLGIRVSNYGPVPQVMPKAGTKSITPILGIKA